MVRAERVDEMVAGGCREKAKLPAIASAPGVDPDAEALARGVAPFGLTKAETEVLHLICLGMTNQEVARHVATTVSMVKWHTNQIFEKLHVRNRLQAVSRVREIAPPALMQAPLAPASPKLEVLNNGEQRILELLSFGLTNRQIAGRLGVTQGTVRWYMRSLFGKLQVRNRVEALRRARQCLWV